MGCTHGFSVPNHQPAGSCLSINKVINLIYFSLLAEKFLFLSLKQSLKLIASLRDVASSPEDNIIEKDYILIVLIWSFLSLKS